MKLQCKLNNLTPHPEGNCNAVCVDVLDLGLVPTFYDGEWRLVPKVRLVFESEILDERGKPYVVARKCRASLHPNSTLYQFLSNWRGRGFVSGETVDLEKLVGLSCTLTLGMHETEKGQRYSRIEGISKARRVVVPSGEYDREEAKRNLELWKAGLRGMSLKWKIDTTN